MGLLGHILVHKNVLFNKTTDLFYLFDALAKSGKPLGSFISTGGVLQGSVAEFSLDLDSTFAVVFVGVRHLRRELDGVVLKR